MKKIISLLVVLVTCISLVGVAAATESASADMDAESSFVYIWSTLKENGDLSVDDSGLLRVDENNGLVSHVGYSEFERLLNVCNQSISDNILVVDPETLELSSVLQLEDDDTITLTPQKVELIREADIAPLNAAHGCSVQACNLLNMCANNYNTLVEYYEDMLRLVLTNPNVSPKGATVGFWVNKVNHFGDWDYKRQPGFTPSDSQFCCYYNSTFNHVTSEYIGNFNYGYTGSFLFNLNMLHNGSYWAAGFDPTDIYTDWPAVDDGYDNALYYEDENVRLLDK